MFHEENPSVDKDIIMAFWFSATLPARELGRGDLAGKVDKFAEMWRSGLRVLVEAYIAARYLPRTYGRNDTAGIAKLVDSLLALLGEVEKGVFGEH